MHSATITSIATLAAVFACSHDRATSAAPVVETTPTPVAVAPATPAAPRPAEAALVDGHITRDEFDAVSRELQSSLEQLAALKILDVGQLVAEQPTGAMNCYGPCEDDPATQAWMQEHARQVDRLHDLVDTAARVAAATRTTASWGEAQAAVRALSDLKIIEIEGIHHESPSCYVAHCPGDPKRAATLVALAKAARAR